MTESSALTCLMSCAHFRFQLLFPSFPQVLILNEHSLHRLHYVEKNQHRNVKIGERTRSKGVLSVISLTAASPRAGEVVTPRRHQAHKGPRRTCSGCLGHTVHLGSSFPSSEEG